MLPFLLSLAAAQTCLPGADCDQDGFTAAQGDCDDNNADVRPGRSEDCGNDIDDNCDGFFNEGCDRDAQQGQLRGGSTCRAETSNAAWLVLPGVLLARRRRRERPC